MSTSRSNVKEGSLSPVEGKSSLLCQYLMLMQLPRPASENAPTSSEQLALDAEMDGTLEGAEKQEQKRQKDENWAQFTDANPKGAGNTMNRG